MLCIDYIELNIKATICNQYPFPCSYDFFIILKGLQCFLILIYDCIDYIEFNIKATIYNQYPFPCSYDFFIILKGPQCFLILIYDWGMIIYK